MKAREALEQDGPLDNHLSLEQRSYCTSYQVANRLRRICVNMSPNMRRICRACAQDDKKKEPQMAGPRSGHESAQDGKKGCQNGCTQLWPRELLGLCGKEPNTHPTMAMGAPTTGRAVVGDYVMRLHRINYSSSEYAMLRYIIT